MDVAVFGPFKRVMRKFTHEFMVNSGVNLTKKDAIDIAPRAWVSGVVERNRNAIAGFRTCGLWTWSYPATQARLRLFQDGGIGNRTKNKKMIEVAPWLREKACAELLTVPAPVDRTRKRRKTLDNKERLFTREMLETLDD